MSNPLCDAYSSYYGVPKNGKWARLRKARYAFPFFRLSAQYACKLFPLNTAGASEAGRVWEFTTGRQSTFIRLSERDITCSTIRKFIGELGRGAIQKRDAKFTRVQPINGTVTT